MFRNAIVRRPAENFAAGLTTAALGAPCFETALAQHERYCDALAACGLDVMQLNADPRYPDSTFVEDTALMTERGAVLARPGAASRAGEVAEIATAIRAFFPDARAIEAPGTLDAGDVCEAGERFFIGLSERTNEEGARQLAAHLAGFGYASSCIDVRGMASLLHLKSGISYIGANTLVLSKELAESPLAPGFFRGYEILRVSAEESYAANCVRVNNRILIAAGFPKFAHDLAARGFDPLALEMSEFQKMDGGLSCLSLRF